jgi:hypothetical protein
MALVFTVAGRDELCRRLLRLGEEHRAVVAGAVVGSLAADAADAWSDLDVTFAVADEIAVADVLDEWTRILVDELHAVPLVDLARGASVYRVFLLPDALQLDLSMSPAADFRPSGPRFRLVFGEIALAPAPADGPPGSLFIDTPAVASDIYGWGVIYALHARACVERGRLWQAEHYIGAVRDHALSMACLRWEVPAVQARGYDDLPEVERRRYEPTLVGALEPEPMRRALAATVQALLHEGAEARLPHAAVVAARLVELT